MNKKKRIQVFSFLVLVLVGGAALIGCSRSSSDDLENRDQLAYLSETLMLKNQMLDVYSMINYLYGHIWSDSDLSDKNTKQEMLEIVDKLDQKFKTIKEATKAHQSEEGFKASLEANIYLLDSIKSQFDYASNDYLKWRLRSMTSNCISCHTEGKAKSDFKGNIPKFSREDIKSIPKRLAIGDFLIATRQFNRANLFFKTLVNDLIRTGDKIYIFDAIKSNLLVSVRVLEEYKKASEWLMSLSSSTIFDKEEKDRLLQWSNDLIGFESPQEDQMLEKAFELLSEVQGNVVISVDEDNFVNTLLATSIIHSTLNSELSKEDRAQAELLLAVSYLHLPMKIFDVYPEVYLTQVILKNPDSNIAQISYDKLYDYIKLQSTGSGGVNIPEEDKLKLKDLKSIAY